MGLDRQENGHSHEYGSIPRIISDCEDEERGSTCTAFDGCTCTRRRIAVVLLASLAVSVVIYRFSLSSTYQKNDTNASLQPLSLWGKTKRTVHENKTPLYFEQQLVDHFAHDNEKQTWSNRYYASSKHFQGPGYPIIVILGGEDAVDEILYQPFVLERLAKEFGAFVLQTEHRFYGASVPTKEGATRGPTSNELKRWMSPEQALADNIRLIKHVQTQLGCSYDRASAEYCPIITVGASYPGFLSAMMRFVYPDVVDMAYASSAPVVLYAHKCTDPCAYFDKVTSVAESASPGCAHAVKSTLTSVYNKLIRMDIRIAAKKMGICHLKLPKYITSNKVLAHEITMMVAFSNADFNMDYHPPGDPTTDLIRACHTFQQSHKRPLERMADYFLHVKAGSVGNPGAKCYDLAWDIPSGPNATITGSDWTGMGDGQSGNAWEFQCCRDLIVNQGFSPESMFLNTPFDSESLSKHCQSRFQVDPMPTRLVDMWHFDDLVGRGGSHILFTNGLNDAWSTVSHLQSLSDSILALNFPTGAHHSDLNTVRDGQVENDDIIAGRNEIERILRRWLKELK